MKRYWPGKWFLQQSQSKESIFSQIWHRRYVKGSICCDQSLLSFSERLARLSYFQQRIMQVFHMESYLTRYWFQQQSQNQERILAHIWHRRNGNGSIRCDQLLRPFSGLLALLSYFQQRFMQVSLIDVNRDVSIWMLISATIAESGKLPRSYLASAQWRKQKEFPVISFCDHFKVISAPKLLLTENNASIYH